MLGAKLKWFALALLYDVWLTISVRRITIEREMKMEMEIETERESDNTKQIFLAIIFICLVSPKKQHKESKIFKLQSLFCFQCLFSGSEIHQGDCIQNWYHIFSALCCAALLNISFECVTKNEIAICIANNFAHDLIFQFFLLFFIWSFECLKMFEIA